MNSSVKLSACCIVAAVAALGAPQFELLDAGTGSLLQPLNHNDTLDLNAMGERILNVRYSPAAGGTVSVEFRLNGTVRSVDDAAPYLLGGQAGGTDGAWLPAPGSYTIAVTEYGGAGGSGAVLFSTNMTVAVADALSHRMRRIHLETGVPNASVRVRMLNHAFPFGSMTKETSAFGISQTDSADEQVYRATFMSNFNCSVAGNAMKWYTQQPDWWNRSPHNNNYRKPGNHRYTDADNWINFHESQGIPVRGHTIFWGEIASSKATPGNQMQDPDWVEALGTNALYWMEQRAKSIVGRYAGRIDEWDFNNELWHGDWYRDTFGPWITKQMADWALEANPNVKLWFNEYSMLTSPSNAQQFRNLLELFLSEQVPIDGIGLQAHFGSPANAPDAATVKASLDVLDDLGRPIKLTEFDCGWTNATETVEADGLETVYRTAFEHPAVEGIIMWGFWEGNHWKPERALWLTDWTPTEQALRYRSLVFDEWWTDAELAAAPGGALDLTLFAGDYELEIDGQPFIHSFSAGRGLAEMSYDGSQLQVNVPLEIDLTRPVHSNVYADMEAVEFAASVSGGTTAVSYVDFYADGTLLKRDGAAPYTAVWLNASPGSHQVWAVACDENGSEDASPTNSLLVKQQNQGNLLANPGFESGTAGWSAFGAAFSTVTSPVYAGSRSGRAYNRTEKWHGIRQQLSGVVQAGRTYALSCRARVGSGTDTCKLMLKVTYTDGSDPDYTQIASTSVGSSGWTELQGEFVYQPDTGKTVAEVFMYISGAQAGVDIHADEFVLEEAPLNALDVDTDGLLDLTRRRSV
jgi:GH35 family endo-1,4-beta-xylanase